MAADEQTELTDPSSIPRKLRKEAPRPEKQYPLYRGRSDGQVVTPMFGQDFCSTHIFVSDVTYAYGDGRPDQLLLSPKSWKFVHA